MARRRGVKERRHREFRAVVRAVKRDKARFIRRLQGLVTEGPIVYLDEGPDGKPIGNCIRFLGAKTKDGYGRLNMMEKGGKHFQIYAHRLFLILRLGRPIRMDHDAGHMQGCPHRDCVRHVFEQHYAENCNTNGIPF